MDSGSRDHGTTDHGLRGGWVFGWVGKDRLEFGFGDVAAEGFGEVFAEVVFGDGVVGAEGAEGLEIPPLPWPLSSDAEERGMVTVAEGPRVALSESLTLAEIWHRLRGAHDGTLSVWLGNIVMWRTRTIVCGNEKWAFQRRSEQRDCDTVLR